jgi:hypothetical protein
MTLLGSSQSRARRHASAYSHSASIRFMALVTPLSE